MLGEVVFANHDARFSGIC